MRIGETRYPLASSSFDGGHLIYGGMDAWSHGVNQGFHIARRHKPAIFAGTNQLRDSSDERADSRSSECHRLHDHHGDAFSKTWQHKRARGEQLLADLDPAVPSCTAHINHLFT